MRRPAAGSRSATKRTNDCYTKRAQGMPPTSTLMVPRAECFAVASEVFFQVPQQLLRHEPALLDVLREFYRQDPQRWTHIPGTS
jgi:Mlc titration factor MtfA (ptsG expression regulator)